MFLPIYKPVSLIQTERGGVVGLLVAGDWRRLGNEYSSQAISRFMKLA
jgi:hypothetical protein